MCARFRFCNSCLIALVYEWLSMLCVLHAQTVSVPLSYFNNCHFSSLTTPHSWIAPPVHRRGLDRRGRSKQSFPRNHPLARVHPRAWLWHAVGSVAVCQPSHFRLSQQLVCGIQCAHTLSCALQQPGQRCSTGKQRQRWQHKHSLGRGHFQERANDSNS